MEADDDRGVGQLGAVPVLPAPDERERGNRSAWGRQKRVTDAVSVQKVVGCRLRRDAKQCGVTRWWWAGCGGRERQTRVGERPELR